MSKEKKKDKKSGKNSQLVIRVQKEERAAFVKLCDSLDSSAAREIRRFMREFVASKTATDEVAKVNAPAGKDSSRDSEDGCNCQEESGHSSRDAECDRLKSQTLSMASAMPCPPPMHIVTMARLPPVRSSS